MNNSTLRNIANIGAHSSIIALSTTRIFEITMVNAIVASIMINTRTVVTTITITAVVTIATIAMIAINTVIIIITSTRLLLQLLLPFLYIFV